MKITVIRGVPGSGKSTYAKSNYNCLILEQDMFFIHDGVYGWSGPKIKMAVEWCQRSAEMSAKLGMDVCIVNTFIKNEHVRFYEELAKRLNADFEVIRVIGKDEWKNIHSVPSNVLENMKKSIESWSGEKIIDFS